MRSNNSGGLGVGVGLFLWGIAFLTFPKFVGLPVAWASWLFWVIGLCVLLFGIMGICIEMFKTQK